MASTSPAAAPRSGPGEHTEYRTGDWYPYPSLQMHIYATVAGVYVMALLWPAGRPGDRRPITIADVTFQPREVTELSIVDWGQRALRKWLEDQMLPGMTEL